MYMAYYYDSEKHQSAGDANQLSIYGKFVSHITCVRRAKNLAELMPKTETEDIVLLIPIDTRIDIENFNPCPEEFPF